VDQWQPYKPTEPEPLSFWELQRINPEVRAWLSVYGTKIDYPICQATPGAEDKYLTTNAKGEYSLSGALFMDTADAADFSDFSTIVYGHHMENEVMFGAITNFGDKEFFDEHRYGNLFANDTDYGLEFLCFLDADAYDKSVYKHSFASNEEREDYLVTLRTRARHWRDDVEVGAGDRILLLSTCAEGYTNAREILVGKICDERFKNPFVKIPNLGSGVDAQEGWLGIPYWCWLVLAVLVILLVVIARMRKANRVHE
jgi:sortase B